MSDLGSHEVRHGGPDTIVSGWVERRGLLAVRGALPGDLLVMWLDAGSVGLLSGPIPLELVDAIVPGAKVMKVILRKVTPGAVTVRVRVVPTTGAAHDHHP